MTIQHFRLFFYPVVEITDVGVDGEALRYTGVLEGHQPDLNVAAYHETTAGVASGNHKSVHLGQDKFCRFSFQLKT